MRTAARVPGLARGEQLGEGPRRRPPRAAGLFILLGVCPSPALSRRRTILVVGIGLPVWSYDRPMVRRVLLASPRGFCAGVERAVETVELALEHYGAPVYVRHQIVHNIHVERDLEARGAIFVEEETEVPKGATVVYSAHGVAPSVYANSEKLGHNVIDAVCPLVTKVHVQARRYADEGYTVVLIGHAGHAEVVGTMGEAHDATVLVTAIQEADA